MNSDCLLNLSLLHQNDYLYLVILDELVFILKIMVRFFSIKIGLSRDESELSWLTCAWKAIFGSIY